MKRSQGGNQLFFDKRSGKAERPYRERFSAFDYSFYCIINTFFIKYNRKISQSLIPRKAFVQKTFREIL